LSVSCVEESVLAKALASEGVKGSSSVPPSVEGVSPPPPLALLSW